MKKGISILIIGIIVVLGIFFVRGSRIERENPVRGDGAVLDPLPSERIPSRFACVGEYCDGHMEGDDYQDRFTRVTVPLVRDGGSVGCGAEIFFAPHAVPKTTAVLDATYRLLFDIKPLPEIEGDWFRNTVGMYTRLFYDRVILEGDVAKVYLRGEMYGPGHCAEPELRAQVLEAALQYPTVRRAEVYLNGTLYDWCAMDMSDGEGPCPEVPQYWVGERR